jgi:hypothetical protein
MKINPINPGGNKGKKPHNARRAKLASRYN